MNAHELVNDDYTPEVLARSASHGDREAQEALVRVIRDQIYGLALRMLAEPADAEDATQEILIKVITRLGSFRGESRFTTWVYAVAVNHLRTLYGRRQRRWSSFEQVSDLQGSLLPVVAPVAEQAVLVQELRLLCLHGLRICLDRDHRLALVLGELLDLSSVEAARVLGIRPATFRKRLSRARQKMRDFMRHHCGLVCPDNPCCCELRVGHTSAASSVQRNMSWLGDLFHQGETQMTKNQGKPIAPSHDVHLEEIRDTYRNASEALRLEMFLHYRELRKQFEDIQREEVR